MGVGLDVDLGVGVDGYLHPSMPQCHVQVNSLFSGHLQPSDIGPLCSHCAAIHLWMVLGSFVFGNFFPSPVPMVGLCGTTAVHIGKIAFNWLRFFLALTSSYSSVIFLRRWR